jgi:lysophospholipase L1-like esterase
MKKKYAYLALGDSYTIGEQILPKENFPNQTVTLINKTADGAYSRRQGFALTPSAVENLDGGYHFTAPKIIAQTGWTTDELDAAIDAANILKQYDIVSLLIGVNNQYRGRPAKDFKIEFEHLLQRAIQFACNKPNCVFVLSIPDWGITPFAEGRNRKEIADYIDAYNSVCQNSAAAFKTHFINITDSQRVDGNKTEFLAPDGLHPSGKEYKKWAGMLADEIVKSLL